LQLSNTSKFKSSLAS